MDVHDLQQPRETGQEVNFFWREVVVSDNAAVADAPRCGDRALPDGIRIRPFSTSGTIIGVKPSFV